MEGLALADNIEALSRESVRATQHHLTAIPSPDRRDSLLALNQPWLVIDFHHYVQCLVRQNIIGTYLVCISGQIIQTIGVGREQLRIRHLFPNK